jgi:hypothetical protein
MSIIIGLITKNNQLFLASDKRGIQNGIIDDNFKKLLPLRPKLYFGMTGLAEYGSIIYENVLRLPNFKEMSVKDIINSFDEFYSQIDTKSTVLVAGKMEDDEVFIWTKRTGAESHLIKHDKQNIVSAINTNHNLELFESRLREEIITSEGYYVTAMRKTIEYASTIDPTISKDCDLILI